jgi:hypothetical protein
VTTRSLSAVRIVLLGVILGGALGARWYRIGHQSFWTDEFLSLEVSAGHGYEHLDEPQGRFLPNPEWLTDIHLAGGWGEMLDSFRRSTHPPLYFCLLRIWRELSPSDSDVSLRSLSAILSMIAILFAFDAARWWHGTKAALWAAAILAVAAPQIEYAQEARGYSLLIATMMACCAALARIETLGFSRRRAVALALAAVAMLLTHYLGAALLGAMIIYAAFRLAGDPRRRVIGILLGSFGFVAIIWGPMLYAQLHAFSHNLSWMIEPRQGLWARTMERLCSLPLRFFIRPATNPGPIAYLSVVLLLLPALLIRKHPQMLIWCLILWINVLVILVGDVARSALALGMMRYTLPAAAAANMIAACAGLALPARYRQLIPAAMVLGGLMALPLSYDRTGPDWREFAGYLDNKCKGDSIVVIYREPYSDGSIGVWDVGLSRYEQSRNRAIVILSKPADSGLLATLRRRGPIDLISISTPADTILPGCTVLQAEAFPYVGSCTRVDFRPSSVSVLTH